MRVFSVIFSVICAVILCGCGSETNLKEYDGMGVFEADSIIISSEINAKIKTLDLKEGSEIKKGSLIATLECKTFELQSKKLQLQIENAMREKARISRLVAGNAAVNRDLDSANFNLNLLKSELDILQDSINKCEIFSPQDCVILEKYANANEFSATGKPLIKLADLKNIRLKAYLNAPDISRVKLGQSVSVFSDISNSAVTDKSNCNRDSSFGYPLNYF